MQHRPLFPAGAHEGVAGSTATVEIARTSTRATSLTSAELLALKIACNGRRDPLVRSAPAQSEGSPAIRTSASASACSSSSTPDASGAGSRSRRDVDGQTAGRGPMRASAQQRPPAVRRAADGLRTLQREFATGAAALTALYRAGAAAHEEGCRAAVVSARQFALLHARRTVSGDVVVPLDGLLGHLAALEPPMRRDDHDGDGVDPALGRKRRSASPPAAVTTASARCQWSCQLGTEAEAEEEEEVVAMVRSDGGAHMASWSAPGAPPTQRSRRW